MLGAIDVRSEDHAIFSDFDHAGLDLGLLGGPAALDLVGNSAIDQAKYLEPAAISQNRAIPAHKGVQPAHARDQLVARLKVQVIGVAKNDLRAVIAHLIWRQRLDCAARADRHEHRRLDRAVRGGD
jgi:hypothetical protein